MLDAEQSVQEAFTSFSNLVKLRLIPQAIDAHCDQDIILLLNTQEYCSSKAFVHESFRKLLQDVDAYSIDFFNVVVDDSRKKVWGEIELRINHKTNGHLFLKSAFFQKWDEGRIKKLKFYYSDFQSVKE